ncbi:phosphonate metabolism transcriptional regulator PhnF [Celeribacter litoreus]|uniref:phosphonate metabolism transcriptional regulator PhnF n=1 Tax=Celeribacter litoreus TaxID=2876714 RepID=UPI001CCECCE8|nr:phosphonate metabolism transcriptional regulator PhnF [Celeribacter litoreus]MCA0044782.1 phosphonate metabolism transcriptional regulator PhnF [Celeribacter litoreus]
MARTAIWTSIATTLQSEIAQGHYPAGGKLPTEAELAERFEVNRHTVRRAIADLVDRGLVRTRRGAGAFVAQVPTDYPIGKRTRFHKNIAATGRLAQKRALRVETRPSNAIEAAALEIAEGAPVVVYEGVSMSGGAPLAHFESIFSEARLPGMAAALGETTSVTAALKACGVEDYTRRETRITAELASATEALHLGLREGAPILRSVSININADGTPVEYGQTRFAGDKVALTVETE